MQDPALYAVLLRNIVRLVEDAELLLREGRYASANALAIYALEEAGKYSSRVGEFPVPKNAKLHIHRQEVLGDYFKSAAIFEAFARELDGMLEYFKAHSPDSYADAVAMPKRDLIRFAIASMSSAPNFDMDKFVHKVLGEDPSLKFGDDARAGDYHRERQQSIHADYDENGKLKANPFEISEEQARRSVEMAWFAERMQMFWAESWKRYIEEDPQASSQDAGK